MKNLFIIAFFISSVFADYVPSDVALNLGITLTEYNYLMALIGFTVGSAFFALMSYIAVSIGNGK